jgi:very-short-patch-repair endonuclease
LTSPRAASALPPMPRPTDVDPDERHSAFDSLFEQRVFRRVAERGFRVVPQYPVEDRRIDLVVIGDDGRLAVECDGRYWHSSPEQRRADMARERDLKRVGWKFWRVTDSEFTLDPDQALEPLWAELERQGITPEPDLGTVPADAPDDLAEQWHPIELPDEDDEMEP